MISNKQVRLTPNEYAVKYKISLVTVNKRIKSGFVNSVKENGRRFIIIDEYINNDNIDIEDDFTEEVCKPFKSSLETLYKERISDLLRMNKQLMKQNKQLTKENRFLNEESKSVFKQFIGEMKLLTKPQKNKKNKK